MNVLSFPEEKIADDEDVRIVLLTDIRRFFYDSDLIKWIAYHPTAASIFLINARAPSSSSMGFIIGK